jgi:hypothetical protein
VVYRTGLENRSPFTRTVGSNPTPSAPRSPRTASTARPTAGCAISQLGWLHETLSPHAYLWLLAALAVICASLARRTGDREEDEGVEAYIGRE